MTMTLELLTIPCRTDNYAYLLHDAASRHTTLIDAPEAAPILKTLAARGWTLHDILITHHHDDHIAGTAELVAATGARVTGAAADAHRLPPLDTPVRDGDTLAIGPETAHVMEVSGHTIGHLAFHLPESGCAFTADTLMAAGCGRLFEGTPAQMYASLTRLAQLPDETLICSGHEYTTANLAFAATIDPDNPALAARIIATAAARAANQPTVPSTLALERATNPFLRATSLAQFTTLRAAKDRF